MHPLIKPFQLTFDLILIAVALIIAWILTNNAPIIDRYISATDPDYLDPQIGTLESLWSMAVFIWIIPISLLAVLSLLILRNIWKTLLLIIVWLETQALVILITAYWRYFYTSPRPYFLTKCQPTRPSGYVMDTSFCSSLVHIERRDVQSFPSGHTSAVWSAWITLILLLSYMTGAFTKKGGFYKVFFLSLFLIVPIWMSSDRVVSGNHRPYEVLFGSLLGILTPLLVFFNMDRSILQKDTPPPASSASTV